jgi:UDP-3-O-[3-hydroxymyristoyl] N-acetylglucosamine deacetylase/3-hydroxyacyl-[acyl-carrier-protein] dehydratase
VTNRNGSRRTIARAATVQGIGLHSGRPATAHLRPPDSATGIVFRRADLADGQPIPAVTDAVSSTDRGTALGPAGGEIRTAEHLLATAYALGIDDLLVEVHGPELPIGDGSAQPYVDAFAAAGSVARDGPAPAELSVRAALTVREGDALYVIAPAAGLRLTVTIDWPHPLIGRQSRCVDVSADAFRDELARARTFGFVAEHEALRARGLALGASVETTLALTATGLAAGTLRWPDEFVRHKALDLVGDLALTGARVAADVIAFRPSHAGNVAVARALRRLADPAAVTVMGIEQILGTLPHRYPMLLVDRVVEVVGRERIVGIKNVTYNEPFFQGHFPGHPVMPGVLILEAMAQAGGMLLMGAVEDPRNKVVYFLSLDEVKFRRPVVPGDQLRFELEMLQFRGRNCRMRGVAYVDGERVAEAEMAARIMDR